MAAVPEGSVVITPAEVYNEVRDLTREVRDLVTADKAEQRERAKLEARVDNLDTRVTALERKVWFVAGICAAVGGTAGSALANALGR